MPAWNRTEGYAYVSFGTSSVAAVVLLLLILRNLLLLLGFLSPHELGCAEFGRALMTSIKSRCRGAVAHNASIGSRPESVSVHKDVANYSTHLSCLFFLVYCIGAATVYMADGFNWLPFSYCKYGIPTNMAVYCLAKAFLYSTLTARLYLGFEDSVYGYGKRTLYGLYSFGVVSMSAAILSICIVARGEIDGKFKKSTENQREVQMKICITSAPMFIWVYGASVDISLTICVVYLFTSALKRSLTNFTKNMDGMRLSQQRKAHAEFFLLPLKYTTISTAAVLSTLAGLILVSATNAAFVIAIDCVVNCCALLLMTKKWNPVYVLLCSPLLRLVARTPCLGCANLAELEIIEAVAQKHKSQRSISSLSPRPSPPNSQQADFSL